MGRQLMIYVGQMTLAIEHCRARYLTNRDIKPANFVLDHHGDLKMIDFGLGSILDIHTGYEKNFALSSGTPVFMSREQNQVGSQGFEVDVSTLGFVLRHIC